MNQQELIRLGGLVYKIDELLMDIINAQAFGQWERVEVCKKELLLAYTGLYEFSALLVKDLSIKDCNI